MHWSGRRMSPPAVNPSIQYPVSNIHPHGVSGPRQHPGSPWLPQQSDRVRIFFHVLRTASWTFWRRGIGCLRFSSDSDAVPRRFSSHMISLPGCQAQAIRNVGKTRKTITSLSVAVSARKGQHPISTPQPPAPSPQSPSTLTLEPSQRSCRSLPTDLAQGWRIPRVRRPASGGS